MSGPPNSPPPPWGQPPPYGAPPPSIPAPPPWGYPAAQPAPASYTRTEPFAIVSLVAALAGGFLCFVGPIVAIVFGHLARSRIKRSGAGGKGMALAGAIIGYVEIVLGFIAIAVIIFVAVNASTDATHSARTLGTQIQIVAARTNSSPRNGDVVREAIHEAGFSDDRVLVGSTAERAVSATTNDLEIQAWRLDVHKGPFGEACLFLPATPSETPTVKSGACPGF